MTGLLSTARALLGLCCVATMSCGPAEPTPQLPEEGGDVVYSASGRAFACEEEGAPCAPPLPRGPLKAHCMDADHSLRLCNCEWVCSGPF